MTTIAIKNTTVSSDTMILGNYIDQIQTHKIKKTKAALLFTSQEVIVGGSGDFSEVMRFMDWVELDGRKENYIPPESASFFLVNEEGVWSFEKYYKPVYLGEIAAFGSGSGFAMGAMLNGASPEEAVKIAMQLDESTGGEIYTLSL